MLFVIVCVDERFGTMFNNRRLSSDRVLCERVLQISHDKTLWMNSYSKKLFRDNSQRIKVLDNFLDLAKKEDFCFVENESLANYEIEIEKLIIYNWNTKYPFDKKFELELTNWQLISRFEFQGNSHKKITEEVYVKNGKKIKEV